MNKSIELTSKGLGVTIKGTNKVILDGKTSLTLENGQTLKISALDLKKIDFENIIVIKDGENLEIAYADGSSITIEGFYAIEDLTLELPTAEYETHILSSNFEGSSFSIVYGQGDLTVFESMFEGNSDALHALREYSSSSLESGLNAGEAVAAEGAAGTSAADTTSISTAALIAGGIVAVGGIAAASGGSSGSGGSGSTSLGDSTSSGDSAVSGQLVDSPVAGVAYYINDATEPSGYTDANGYFTYSAGDTVTFKVGDVTLKANYDTTNIPSDKKVTLQDLLDIDRHNTSDATVVKMAQFLQTLDADGNADNGIQIIRNSEDSVIYTNDDDVGSTEDLDTDNDGVVSQEEYDNAMERFAYGTNKILEDDASGELTSSTNLNAGSGTIVGGHTVKTETEVKEHLEEQLEKIIKEEVGVDDIADLKVNSLEALAIAIESGLTYIIATNSLDLRDLSSLTTEQQTAINSYTGKLVINDGDSNDSPTGAKLTITLEQAKNMSFENGENDSVEVVITDDDSVENEERPGTYIVNLVDVDLSDVDSIYLNTNTSTAVKMTLDQAMKTGNSTSNSVLIEDTIDNLTGFITGSQEALAVSNALSVNVKLTEDTDFSELDISNSSIDVIITGDYTAYITGSMYLKANLYDELFFSYDGTESTVGSTIILKDSYTNILNSLSSTTDIEIILTGTPSISEIKDIEALTSADVTYSAISDDYETLTNSLNADYFTSNPAIIVSTPATINVVQADNVTALTTNDVTYHLADTLANLEANATITEDAASYTLTDDVSDISSVTVEQALIIDGATNASSYTYTLEADLTLAELEALDTLPATYNLADIAGDLGNLTVAQAEIVLGADNYSSAYTYSLVDTAENLLATASSTILSADAITITDKALDANKVATILEYNSAVINPTSITGKWNDINSTFNSFNSTKLSVDGSASFSITVTDTFSATISASQLATVAAMQTSYGITAINVQNPLTLTNIDATAIESLTADDSIISLPSNINFKAGTESSVGTLSIEQINILDAFTTGVIEAQIESSLEEVSTTLKNENGNNMIHIHLTDAEATDATELLALLELTDGVISVLNISEISGSIQDIAKVKEDSQFILSTGVEFIYVLTSEENISDILDLINDGESLDLNNVQTLNGSTEDILSLYAEQNTTSSLISGLNDTINIQITDTTLKASDILSIESYYTSANISHTATSLEGVLSDINSSLDLTNPSLTNITSFTITDDSITLSEYNLFVDSVDASSSITATISDTPSNLDSYKPADGITLITSSTKDEDNLSQYDLSNVSEIAIDHSNVTILASQYTITTFGTNASDCILVGTLEELKTYDDIINKPVQIASVLLQINDGDDLSSEILPSSITGFTTSSEDPIHITVNLEQSSFEYPSNITYSINLEADQTITSSTNIGTNATEIISSSDVNSVISIDTLQAQELYITGDSADKVNISLGWEKSSTTTVDGVTYVSYNKTVDSQTRTIHIDQDITEVVLSATLQEILDTYTIDTLPEKFILTDTDSYFYSLSIADAKILAEASNASSYKYSINDSKSNLDTEFNAETDIVNEADYIVLKLSETVDYSSTDLDSRIEEIDLNNYNVTLNPTQADTLYLYDYTEQGNSYATVKITSGDTDLSEYSFDEDYVTTIDFNGQNNIILDVDMAFLTFKNTQGAINKATVKITEEDNFSFSTFDYTYIDTLDIYNYQEVGLSMDQVKNLTLIDSYNSIDYSNTPLEDNVTINGEFSEINDVNHPLGNAKIFVIFDGDNYTTDTDGYIDLSNTTFHQQNANYISFYQDGNNIKIGDAQLATIGSITLGFEYASNTEKFKIVSETTTDFASMHIDDQYNQLEMEFNHTANTELTISTNMIYNNNIIVYNDTSINNTYYENTSTNISFKLKDSLENFRTGYLKDTFADGYGSDMQGIFGTTMYLKNDFDYDDGKVEYTSFYRLNNLITSTDLSNANLKFSLDTKDDKFYLEISSQYDFDKLNSLIANGKIVLDNESIQLYASNDDTALSISDLSSYEATSIHLSKVFALRDTVENLKNDLTVNNYINSLDIGNNDNDIYITDIGTSLADLIYLQNNYTGSANFRMEGEAREQSFSDTYANIKAAFENVAYGYLGDLTITDSSISVEQLEITDDITRGKVTANFSINDINTYMNDTTQYAGALDNSSVILNISDTAVTISNILDLDTTLTRATILLDSTTTLSGTASDVETLLNAITNGGITVSDANFNISDVMSANTYALLDNATTGTITVSSIEGTLSELETIDDLNGITYSTTNYTNDSVLTVAQAQILDGATTVYSDDATTSIGMPIYTIVDTVANLSPGTDIDLSSATAVTAKVEATDTDLTNNTLDDEVDTLDLSGIAGISLTSSQASSLDIIDSSSSKTGTVSSIKIEESSFDLSNIDTDITGLTTIDATDTTDTAISLTVADLFAVNDTAGNLVFTLTGTNGGGDTVDLTGWTDNTANVAGQYTKTGNFDGVDGDETYTINVTDVTVTIA